MDDVDRAQEIIEADLAEALYRRERAARLRSRISAKQCMVCGDDIPFARRFAVPGCIRCVDCQNDHEHGRAI